MEDQLDFSYTETEKNTSIALASALLALIGLNIVFHLIYKRIIRYSITLPDRTILIETPAHSTSGGDSEINSHYREKFVAPETVEDVELRIVNGKIETAVEQNNGSSDHLELISIESDVDVMSYDIEENSERKEREGTISFTTLVNEAPSTTRETCSSVAIDREFTEL